MKAQTKAQSASDIAVYADKGSLALRFPKRHNALWEQLDGKSLKGKPKCLGIGKYGFSADEPDDWKRATAIAIALEADLDHPEWEKLFDPTLAKYGLGGGKYAKLAEVLQLPGTIQTVPEITVGEMWEAYLEWKKTVVEETTFRDKYLRYLSNAIAGKVWDKKVCRHLLSDSNLRELTLTNCSKIDSCLAEINISRKSELISALNEAFDLAKSKGLIVHSATKNPFDVAKFATPVVTTQQKYASKIVDGVEVEWHETEDEEALETDRRSFTKDERDTIVKAFYESPKKTQSRFAPLIEFYFLTGCRTSEALALTWKDVDFERNVIRFSKSLGFTTRKVKTTKTNEVRLFYFHENSRLKALLLDLRNMSNNSLIFPNEKGGFLCKGSLNIAWRDSGQKKTLSTGEKKTYYYPGLVSELARQGKVSGYLTLYHTRHTYITLTAHANAHNNNALLYIASSCGNSVDVILRHYLGINESVELVQV
ncbi:MAG: tyrosine-type recombinase/integrase [Microcoleus sp.]